MWNLPVVMMLSMPLKNWMVMNLKEENCVFLKRNKNRLLVGKKLF